MVTSILRLSPNGNLLLALRGLSKQFEHTYSFSATSTQQGSYTVAVYDRAGNHSNVSLTLSRDVTDPTVTVQAVANGTTVNVTLRAEPQGEAWTGNDGSGAGVAWYDPSG